MAPIVPSASGGPLSFLDGFEERVVSTVSSKPQVVGILPLFRYNEFLRQYEVPELGMLLGSELERRLLARLDSNRLIPAIRFRREVRVSNRSLADLRTPADALKLGGRIGLDSLIRGTIVDGDAAIRLEVEWVDIRGQALDRAEHTVRASEPEFASFKSLLRDARGQPRLSASFRIGDLADPSSASLREELQWIIGLAARDLIREGGDPLSELPLAVLPTRLPDSFEFLKYQRAIRERIQIEKKRLMDLGHNEAKAMNEGPVYILGVTYPNLRAAEDRANKMALEEDLSQASELSATLSGILYDKLEAIGDRVKLIPHKEIVDEILAFDGKERDQLLAGTLSGDSKTYFQTRGARALVFNRLIGSDFGYQLVFRVRRLDNAEPLTPEVSYDLEPRFAYELRGFLDGTKKRDGK